MKDMNKMLAHLRSLVTQGVRSGDPKLTELAAHFDELDGCLRKGEQLPDAWERGRTLPPSDHGKLHGMVDQALDREGEGMALVLVIHTREESDNAPSYLGSRLAEVSQAVKRGLLVGNIHDNGNMTAEPIGA